MRMKILSWNVNGLRKLAPLDMLFKRLDADIICLQETRVSGKSDPHLEPLAFVNGYHSFFSICRHKRGYSGVATFCRKAIATPVDAGEDLAAETGGAVIRTNPDGSYGVCLLEGCPCERAGCPQDALQMLQDEGRCVITDHGRFVLFNVYLPAVSVEGRDVFKMRVLHALEAKITALRGKGRHVVVAGDFNICPSVSDMAEPLPPSAMTPWEQRPSRRWLMGLIGPSGLDFVDSFREAHPNATGVYSCWSEATRARENNHGVRIDLILMDRELFKADVSECGVHAHIKGSDHCPVSVTMQCANGWYPSPRDPPQFCTLYTPRFSLRQSYLKDMLQASKTSDKGPNPNLASSQGMFSRSLKQNASGQTKKSVPSSSSVQKRKGKRTQATISTFFASQAREECTPSSRSMSSRRTDDYSSKAGGSKRDFGALNRACTELEPECDRKRQETAAAWRKLLSGPPPPPLCRHGKACVLKAVGKTGENRGRTFFSCPFPAGVGDAADCKFFKWAPFKAGMGNLPKQG